jgi:hypothetical protein
MRPEQDQPLLGNENRVVGSPRDVFVDSDHSSRDMWLFLVPPFRPHPSAECVVTLDASRTSIGF